MAMSPDLELARIAAKARREAARHLKRAVQAEKAAVESPGEYNLERSCLTVGRNLERLAGTDPFFNLV
jgi:hypothetical protein